MVANFSSVTVEYISRLIFLISHVFLLSWSPRGALLTAMNGAKYLQDGKVGGTAFLN